MSRKFLTIVADHDTGNVIWVGKEHSKAAFEHFFTSVAHALCSAGRTTREARILLDDVRARRRCEDTDDR